MTATFARDRAYLANARAFGRRWRDYFGLAAVAAAVIAGIVLVPGVPMRQLLVGIVLGAITMSAVLSASRFDAPQMRGYLAETFSLESLRKVPNWLIIDNLPFDDVDVDNVVVTPSGVLAVESKHHAAVSEATFHRDIAAAYRAARKIRLFLRSKGHALATVTPVLMVWGPGSHELPKGFRLVDDVYIVDPAHPELWAYRFAAPLMAPAQRTQVYDVLASYAQTRRRHNAKQTDSLRSRMWQELKAGVRDEREARAARRLLVQTTRRRPAQEV